MEKMSMESDHGLFEDIEDVTPLSAMKDNLQHVKTLGLEDAANDLRAFRALDLSDRPSPFKSDEQEGERLRHEPNY